MLQILYNNALSSSLVQLAFNIFHEHSWFCGRSNVQRYMFYNMPKIQSTEVNSAILTVSSSKLMKEEPSEESMESTSATFDFNAEEMSSEEIQHFMLMQHKKVSPFHHFLRLCLDATFTQEEKFMAMTFSGGVAQYIWDVPEDTPLDALGFHIQKHVAAAIDKQTLDLYKHMLEVNYKRCAFLESRETFFRWILKHRTRIVLLVDLIAFQVFQTMYESRTVNSKHFILNRINTNINKITNYFKKFMLQ